MKYILLIPLFFLINSADAAYMWQCLNEARQANRIDYTPIHFYSEAKPYTKEGITFTFPIDYFTTSPHVHVSLQHDSSADNTPITFYSLITELSASSAKVNVYKVNAGIIHDFTTEANSDEIIVHVLALGY